MLSPHVDHLIDQGFLSFAPDGAVLFAPGLREAVIKQWPRTRRVAARPFNDKQAAFMNYHGNHVFRSRWNTTSPARLGVH